MADELDVILHNLDININAAVRRAAIEIGEKIQDEYENTITQFYMAYDPIMYDRTDSLYKGSKGVGGIGKYYKQLSKNNYECGINVGAENYSGNPYVKPYPHGLEMDPSIVFPNAWDKGMHGFSSYNVRQQHKGKKKGDKSYWSVKHTPPRTAKPKSKMNKAFKKYDNAGYVFGVIEKYLGELGGF